MIGKLLFLDGVTCVGLEICSNEIVEKLLSKTVERYDNKLLINATIKMIVKVILLLLIMNEIVENLLSTLVTLVLYTDTN